jgi:hypothetical protein
LDYHIKTTNLSQDMKEINTFTGTILQKMPDINKCQRKFIQHLLLLFLSMRQRMNYMMMSRHGVYCEQTYRIQFSKEFDFKAFNTHLINEHCGKERIIIFDPSYVNKSGKSTPGVGYFWSGCAGSVKWGLELSSIAIGDVENHTALHYEVCRTHPIKKADEITLLDYYANLLGKQSKDLQKISKTACFDAFFSKEPFVSKICAAGFTMVSRLQNNIYLRYRYTGEQRKGRGRHKVYDGKIDLKNLSMEHFKVIKKDENEIIYEGEAHVRCLKRWCKIVITHTLKEGKINRVTVNFSTDINMEGLKVLEYYKMRYQIEFLFRDGKGHLGLEDTQSRQPEALDFHYNASLTALNVAKATHWYSIEKDQRTTFSIRDIKTQYCNEMLLDRLISIYGKDPIVEKNNPEIMELYNLGRIAA